MGTQSSDRLTRRVVCGLLLLATGPLVLAAPAGETARVSVGVGQADGASTSVSLSSSGRLVAFASDATNLVVGDENQASDIFVHDRRTGLTTRVSVGSEGGESDGASSAPCLSSSGRLVAFVSEATDLVSGDGNGQADVFVHDRKTGVTSRVSVDSAGAEADGASSGPALAGSGRHVVFSSAATNLVPGDDNDASDVFVHDRKTGRTARVSVDSSGGQSDGPSSGASISASGRYVVFSSSATNLVPDDDNGASDVFAHDLKTGVTTRVSVGSSGGQAGGPSSAPALSANGRFVAFASAATDLVAGDANGEVDVFVHDRKTGETQRVSVDAAGAEGDALSTAPGISASGRLVTFESLAGNLVAGDGDDRRDVFVHDLRTRETTRWSGGLGVAPDGPGSSAPTISSNGRLVAYQSEASDLVVGDGNGAADVFVHDQKTDERVRVSVTSRGTEGNGLSSDPAISANRRTIAFASASSNLVVEDNNGVRDVFVHDRRTGLTERVSVRSTGAEPGGESRRPALSSSGRVVAFESDAHDLVAADGNGVSDIFVHDRRTGITARVSIGPAGAEADGASGFCAVSASGRLVAFESVAGNLVPGDDNAASDVFVHDRKTGATTRVSVTSSGAEADGPSWFPALSGSGRYVVFSSAATNLVPGDGNGHPDIFVHDLKTGGTTRVSVGSTGAQGDGSSFSLPAISRNGRLVAFSSSSTNLVPGDTNGRPDIFVHDRGSGVTTRVSVDSAGGQGDGGSFRPSLSANGRVVAFGSEAGNLAPGDANAVRDVFVHDLGTGQTTRVSVDSEGAGGHGFGPALSLDGRSVAFTSSANDLVTGDGNGTFDVFVHSRK